MADFDDVMKSGDPEAMEQYLARMEAGELAEDTDENADVVDDDSEETLVIEDPEALALLEAETAAAEPEAGTEEEQQQASSEPEPEETAEEEELTDAELLSKDGKHKIPYSVLEDAREALRTTKQHSQQAIDALTAQLNEAQAKLEENNRLLSLRDKQLQKAGIEAMGLPETQTLTEEQLDKMEEDYGPDIAAAFRVMHANLQATQAALDSRMAKAEPSAQPVDNSDPVVVRQRTVLEEIARNPDLSAWQQGDPERFEFAVHVDNRLMADPAFKDKPLAERFAEAARRTKVFFDGPESVAAPEPKVDPTELAKQAKAAIEKATPTTPRSLTDVATTNADADKPVVQRMAELSPEQLTAQMARMSPAEVDALLAGISL